MIGPFYVKDKDFQDQQVYVLAKMCKECAFVDEKHGFCCQPDCIVVPSYDDEESEHEK